MLYIFVNRKKMVLFIILSNSITPRVGTLDDTPTGVILSANVTVKLRTPPPYCDVTGRQALWITTLIGILIRSIKPDLHVNLHINLDNGLNLHIN
jgi:hypothetical protein